MSQRWWCFTLSTGEKLGAKDGPKKEVQKSNGCKDADFSERRLGKNVGNKRQPL